MNPTLSVLLATAIQRANLHSLILNIEGATADHSILSTRSQYSRAKYKYNMHSKQFAQYQKNST